MTIAFLAASIWVVAEPQAWAYQIGGPPWPAGSVNYYSRGGAHAGALVDRAARMWNRARAGIVLRRSRAADAQVLVSGTRSRCGGRATVGYPQARPSLLTVGRCQSGLMVLTIAHEFGHVLGLGHEWRRCALMNPSASLLSGTPSRCRPRPLGYWLQRALQPDDIRGARALAFSRLRWPEPPSP